MKRICVTSNCQTAGLAAALQELLPEVQVEALALTQPSLAEFARDYGPKIQSADAWLALTGNDWVQRLLEKIPGLEARCLRVPAVAFTAFHPDLCYAWNRETKSLTQAAHYNSLIGVWGYKRGLTAQATARFFTREVFAALGYFDHWGRCVDQLRWQFDHSVLKGHFDAFFLKLKRTGCFMHSINHPRLPVMTGMAEILVGKLGLEPTPGAHLDALPDALQSMIWPVYPEIAEHHGLKHGAYNWRFDMHRSKVIHGLESYLERIFASYRAQGLNRDNFEIAFRDASHELQMLDRLCGNLPP
jgi:hypothetical protein